jgi:hypothetical protein
VLIRVIKDRNKAKIGESCKYKENLKRRRLMITSKMMQQLWAVIESTQVSTLLQFDDSALVQLLLCQFKNQQSIDAQTANSLNTYIRAKLPLIRDIAEGKLSIGQSSR